MNSDEEEDEKQCVAQLTKESGETGHKVGEVGDRSASYILLMVMRS